ncbi:hypothetical protein GPECTOR_58g602 [Gonium pectorale]|uniref:Uncharacterized protein n=1 Tax=Gonium pectorale TaxID=33097 RepID=A0A150G5W0_GONPE|nr:hypothetical protein GPECTOR_58g602 [Gonium pectorale]|eukprot:KXZ45153.1 hypothetical protein GPECTOR_58g602 [Gonium pectorale]
MDPVREQKQQARKDVKQLLRALTLEQMSDESKRCYVPVVEDKQSNMKFLHLDDMGCLRNVPPFDILEPPDTYGDGSPRQDGEG